MNTIFSQTMKVPSSEELHQALLSFFTISAGITCIRAHEYGPKRFSIISKDLANAFANQLTINEVAEVVSDFDDKSAIVLATIYEELAYISKRYESCGRLLNDKMVIPALAAEYDVPEGDPLDGDSVKEIDIIKGSLTFVLEKLPKWVQKILDVLMELLKISRGAI